jgi:hypothetical protein
VEDVELGGILVVVDADASDTTTDDGLVVGLEDPDFEVRTARARGVDVAPVSSARETPTAIRMQAKMREMSALRWRSGRATPTPLSDSMRDGAVPSGESDTAAASRSHWGHREPDIVWSHVRRASDP